jgi:hypothetical protein
MTALIVPGAATATPNGCRSLLGPDALRRFAGRFEADLLALAEAGR